jgi:hypothetical protein
VSREFGCGRWRLAGVLLCGGVAWLLFGCGDSESEVPSGLAGEESHGGGVPIGGGPSPEGKPDGTETPEGFDTELPIEGDLPRTSWVLEERNRDLTRPRAQESNGPAFSGRVIGMAREGRGIFISIAEDDDIRRDDVLRVWRSGAHIADVRVERVFTEIARARPVGAVAGNPELVTSEVRVGDDVSR